MRDFKRLIVGFLSLLVIIVIGVFSWSWVSNSRSANPLPIMASNDIQPSVEDDSDTLSTITLSVQAVDDLQTPLEDIITRFEYLYPKIKVTTRYVPSTFLLKLSDLDTDTDADSHASNDTNKAAHVVNIDLIISENKLKQDDLTLLQLNKNAPSKTSTKPQVDKTDTAKNGPNHKHSSADADNEAWNPTPFSYALKGSQSADGVILTDNPAAITFRNFLLSSSGQDILKKYGYDDIDGYKNSVDELFNPSSNKTTADDSVEVADALSGEK